MALWLAFAAAAAAVTHGAHAAVQNEAPSAGIVETERRRLDTPYSYTYTYADGRSKEIRTCMGCHKTKQYKDQNGCPDGFNIWVPEDYEEADIVRNKWLASIFSTGGALRHHRLRHRGHHRRRREALAPRGPRVAPVLHHIGGRNFLGPQAGPER